MYLNHFFKLTKTILLNSLRSHLAQYQHLRGRGALGLLSLIIIFHRNTVHTVKKL